jgi:hypothetical protein
MLSDNHLVVAGVSGVAAHSGNLSQRAAAVLRRAWHPAPDSKI